MEAEILDLFCEYSKKGLLADEEYVKKIIKIVRRHKNLRRYVKKVESKDKFIDPFDMDNKGIASFEHHRKSIVIYKENFAKNLKECEVFDPLFTGEEKIMYRNAVITLTVLHELDHADQKKMVCNKKDNSEEAVIIRAIGQFEVYNLSEKKLKKGDIDTMFKFMDLLIRRRTSSRLYIFNPAEKMASVNSSQTIIDVLNPIRESYPELHEFFSAVKIEHMLTGYGEAWEAGKLCPTEVYLDATNNGDIWSDLGFSTYDYNVMLEKAQSQYSLTRRLTLGFPISPDEYDEKRDWLDTTNKHRFIKN